MSSETTSPHSAIYDPKPLLRLADQKAGFTPHSIFERQAPLEIEVGTGKGLFLANAAAANPDRNYVGIEVALKYARVAAKRIEREQLTNAAMLHGDAHQLFGDNVATASTAAVHVYFPDPWWKKRHRKRRVMNQMFIANVHRVLEQSGTLHFWTDVLEYFEATISLIAENGGFSSPQAVLERPSQHDLDYHTHFERRMRKNELPVYRAKFKKLLVEGRQTST